MHDLGVRLAPYDPMWPAMFDAEAARIEAACAGHSRAVKRELAIAYANDRRGYTDAKGPFIRSVIRDARHRSAGSPDAG